MGGSRSHHGDARSLPPKLPTAASLERSGASPGSSAACGYVALPRSSPLPECALPKCPLTLHVDTYLSAHLFRSGHIFHHCFAAAHVTMATRLLFKTVVSF